MPERPQDLLERLAELILLRGDQGTLPGVQETEWMLFLKS